MKNLIAQNGKVDQLLIKLAEMVAIGILQDQRNTDFENYSLTLKRNTDLQIHKMMW